MSTLAEQVVAQLKTDMDNVYDAGYQKGLKEVGGLDVSKFGIQNEVKGTSVVTLDYINENEHEVEVKLSSDTVTDFSGVEVKCVGKNLSPLSEIKVGDYHYQDVYITENIVVSAKNNDVLVGSAGWIFTFTRKNGSVSYVTTNDFYGKEVQATKDNPIVQVIYRGTIIQSGYYSDIQFEYNKMTEYQPYTEKNYTANADGTVDGVTSISLGMNIICDGVDITAKYYCCPSVEYDRFWDSIYEQIKKTTHRIFNGNAWNDTTFQPPRNTVIVMTQDGRYAFSSMMVKNLKSCLDDRGVRIDFTNIKYAGGIFVDNTELEYVGELDLSTIINEVNFDELFQRCKKLISIDKIKFGSNVSIKGQPFNQCEKLENVTFEGEFTLSISFAQSSLLSDATVQNIIDCLADLTGQTTQTITFHTNVKAKLTEEQIATITSKNWTLA